MLFGLKSVEGIKENSRMTYLAHIENNKSGSNKKGDNELLWLWRINSSDSSHKNNGNDFGALGEHHEWVADSLHGIAAAVHGAEVEESHHRVSLGETRGQASRVARSDNDYCRNHNGDCVLETED